MFVQCKTLRNELLTAGSVKCAVDATGIVELPDAVAEALISGIPSEYAEATEVQARPKAQEAEWLRVRAESAEQIADRLRSEHAAEREALMRRAEAAELHVTDRDRKLADAREQIVALQAKISQVDAIKERERVSASQVQQLLQANGDLQAEVALLKEQMAALHAEHATLQTKHAETLAEIESLTAPERQAKPGKRGGR